MKEIHKSAEYHYLTFLEELKPDLQNWIIFHYTAPGSCRHSVVLDDPLEVSRKIAGIQKKSTAIFKEIMNIASDMQGGYAYLFSDGDIILLFKAASEKNKTQLYQICHHLKSKLTRGSVDIGPLAEEIYYFQKLADRKLLMVEQMRALNAMSDPHMVSSISARRNRREEPILLIVEDDRFTAAYTSSILSREYDLVVARTGEEGIRCYAEYAPNIVFLDIHLPGINGHEALKAIRRMDPQACVIMLSVDSVKDNIVEASRTGAQSFIKKPFSKERLVSTVKHSEFLRDSRDFHALH